MNSSTPSPLPITSGGTGATSASAARTALGLTYGAVGSAVLAAATETAAQQAMGLVAPSPWHVLGTLDGSNAEWVLATPVYANVGGKRVVIRTNTGANVNFDGEDLIQASGGQSVQVDDGGIWSRQATSASAGSTVGYYCIDAGTTPFPRPFRKGPGFMFAAVVKISGTTSRRMVFGASASTSSSAGLATMCGAFQQSTLSGWWIVHASDGTSATKVYAYSSLAGTGYSSAADTGITVATNDRVLFAVYTAAGLSGDTTKAVMWEVINLTTGTVARGTYAGTAGVDAPANNITVFPAQGLLTTAASAINNDTQTIVAASG